MDQKSRAGIWRRLYPFPRAVNAGRVRAVRALCRIPGATALSIVTLGFGIAAATATFSAVYAAVLRPLPFVQPDHLLFLHTTRQTRADGVVRFRWSVAAAGMVRQTGRQRNHLVGILRDAARETRDRSDVQRGGGSAGRRGGHPERQPVEAARRPGCGILAAPIPAMISAAVPAWRASVTDPMIVLRR